MGTGQQNRDHGQVSLFPTTRWSLVAKAGDAHSDDRHTALAEIFRRYQPALRSHLLYRRIRPDRVDDLVQAFVADRVIERNLLAYADRGRGGFRAFLVTSLNNFVANQMRADRALRRRPAGGSPLSLSGGDERTPAPAVPADPAADPFEVAWARAALEEALRRMKADCLAAARPDLWDLFDARMLAPLFDDAEPTPYEVLAERHGYDSWKQAANALVTAKRRFEQTLRSVLAEHVADESELDQELRQLGEALACPSDRQADRDRGRRTT